MPTRDAAAATPDAKPSKQADEDRAVAALRAQLAAAERANRDLSEGIAAANHDLRQPLRALRYLLAALAHEQTGDRAGERIETMERCLDSIEEQLDRLLVSSMSDEGLMRPEITALPLGPLLGRLRSEFAPQAAAKGLRLRVVPTARVVRSDQLLLQTVLRNLISNAIEYTPSGDVLIGCRSRAGRARVEVIDTGIGIDEHRQREVFEPYRRVAGAAHAQGRGLGLAIVERIAKLLDHPMGMRSRIDQGSTFWIEMPQAKARSPGRW